MPVFLDDGSATSVNIDSSSARTSDATGTAARKFSAPNSIQNTQPGAIRTNDSHLLDQAAGLKGTALAIESLVEQARANLNSAVSDLASQNSKELSEERQENGQVTESDLHFSTSARMQNLAASISSKSKFIDAQSMANDLLGNASDSVFSRKIDLLSQKAFNSVIPSLDLVTVAMDKNRGTVDCFFSKLKFSIPLSDVWDGKTKAVRILRCDVSSPKFARGEIPNISLRGLDRLSTLKMRSRSKGLEQTGVIQKRYDEIGVSNSLSNLNPIDYQTNTRLSSSPNSIGDNKVNPSSKSSNSADESAYADVQSFLDPTKFSNLDKSVANDLNVLKNLKNQFSGSNYVTENNEVSLVSHSIKKDYLLNDSQALSLSRSRTNLLVASNNQEEFKELAFVSLDKIKSTIIGDRVEYEFFDESVSLGRGFKYYLTSVNQNMIESVRSKIVEITIEGVRIPERPRRVFCFNTDNGVSLNILVDEQLVEKFEVFRRDANPALTNIIPKSITVISDSSGFNSSIKQTTLSKNGFSKIGECVNGNKYSGSTFQDRTAIPGRKYVYRVYSVDVFSNKSESPYEVEIFVPARGMKTNELTKPDITAEIDQTTGKVKLTLNCSDDRVKSLMIDRKDLTVNQKVFTTPSQVNRIKFGNSHAAEGSARFEDILLRGENKDVAWTGLFENKKDKIIFVDKTVTIDHVYQYRICGIDLFGNKTSYDVTKPLMVINRPMINMPVDVVADVMQGPKFSIDGIRVQWKEGNIDTPPEDRIGNQTSLSDSSVRTLYQVERRKLGEDRWEEFAMTDKSSIYDYVGRKMQYGPTTLVENQTYIYRVKAVQSGSFISNYSEYAEVFCSLPMTPPTNMKIRIPDASVSPFFITINWDTPIDSGIVDSWTIERCEMNNIAAASINMSNPFDFKKLNFFPFIQVFRESSRFSSQETDYSKIQDNFSQHTFRDTSIRFGNTYFYRIRSNGTNASESAWVYRGVKVTSLSTERTMREVMTPELRSNLALTGKALAIKGLDRLQGRNDSFSLQPNFSSPTKLVSQTTTSRIKLKT